MIDRRRRVGTAGERLAAAFLERHDVRVLATNFEIGGGEIDLLAMDGVEKVVVEVRSVTGPADPLGAYDNTKAAQVWRLARLCGADRVDLVAVHLTPEACEIRWVKGAA